MANDDMLLRMAMELLLKEHREDSPWSRSMFTYYLGAMLIARDGEHCESTLYQLNKIFHPVGLKIMIYDRKEQIREKKQATREANSQ
jgi:hypothetical protein